MTPEILNDLKRGILLTGRLSEVHVKTLQAVPFIFFDEVGSVSISYDISTDTSGAMPGLGSKIAFVISFKGDYQPDLLKDRVAALKNTVKTILWPEVKVIVEDSKGKNLDVEPNDT
jgi:hypothetical protein